MVIAIDGPAGAGKSTVTRLLAQRLGFAFLDTGAMYRAVTLAAVKRNVSWDATDELLQLAGQLTIQFDGESVFLDSVDVTEEIRTPEVTRNIFHIADHPGIRDILVKLQREIAASGNYVCEGRDQGTVAFPDAALKIYLDASPQHRAIRRVQQMESDGKFVDIDQVIIDQKVRDQRDLNRPVGRLMRAADAIEVNTDNKSVDAVIEELEALAKSRMSSTGSN